jgi:hypothetical protein
MEIADTLPGIDMPQNLSRDLLIGMTFDHDGGECDARSSAFVLRDRGARHISGGWIRPCITTGSSSFARSSLRESRPQMITSHPNSANTSAIASPILEPPPVIGTVGRLILFIVTSPV